MFNKAKTEDILKGREVLRVNSLHKSVSKRNKKLLTLFATLFYIIGMAYGFWTSSGDDYFMFAWTFMLTMLYGAGFFIIFYLSGERGKPLIMTERGIVAPPSMAERWEDIESYRWEEFKGLNKIPGPTVFSVCEGVSLRIRNKGLI